MICMVKIFYRKLASEKEEVCTNNYLEIGSFDLPRLPIYLLEDSTSETATLKWLFDVISIYLLVVQAKIVLLSIMV